MIKKRTYFPRTTAQQRRLLFEVWEATGDVAAACRQAHVCERTFYNWHPRFKEGGYAALEKFRSPVPKNPRRTPPEVEEQVIALRRQHADWGKQRLADELSKGNNWVPLVSPNTVKRILADAGLWQPAEATAKKGALNP
ncbi:MAG: helix-turn-helix domain-containing protein [Gammaproteobacteria bacterium]|nr:helix-turn-helix domain-containing protein [Gammaproteobacteria bacterium]